MTRKIVAFLRNLANLDVLLACALIYMAVLGFKGESYGDSLYVMMVVLALTVLETRHIKQRLEEVDDRLDLHIGLKKGHGRK